MHMIALRQGFSLVELSIVLVIIGLLVGGILSGKALIEAATIRSQINQISNYQVAARTFRDKYFFLPGDLTEPTASAAGFKPRSTNVGTGDGNGLLEGIDCNFPTFHGGAFQSIGESAVFWTDLSQSQMIPGGFTRASATACAPVALTASSSPSLKDYFPVGKITGTYVLVGSSSASSFTLPKAKNYLFLQKIDIINSYIIGGAAGGLTVSQSYTIDSKIDDAVPDSGKVTAAQVFSGSIITNGPWKGSSPAPADAFSCYDNNNNVANPRTYSMSIDNGSSKYCGLAIELGL